jgi:hypothetical protein
MQARLYLHVFYGRIIHLSPVIRGLLTRQVVDVVVSCELLLLLVELVLFLHDRGRHVKFINLAWAALKINRLRKKRFVGLLVALLLVYSCQRWVILVLSWLVVLVLVVLSFALVIGFLRLVLQVQLSKLLQSSCVNLVIVH